MQMLFWMAYCCCYGFISYYLIDKGFNTSIVGIVSAIAGLISAVGQPFIGSIADKSNVGYKKPLMVSLVSLIIFSIILCYFSIIGFGAGICLMYGIIMLILGIASPLVNTAGVVFANEINFGMARGMGSLGYATASYIMGYLTAKVGSIAIPVSISIFSLVMIFITATMPNHLSSASETKSTKSKTNVLKKYPAFTFLWVSFLFILTVHMLSNTYLLQILEKGGGDSHTLGIAVAIGAIMEIPMIFYFEKVNKWISIKNLFILSASTYLLRSLLQLLCSNVTIFYLIQLLQLTSWGIYASASVYYAKETIPAEDQAQAQAYMTNALTIGTIISALIGGRLIDMYGVNAMLIFQCLMGALGLLGIVIWSRKYQGADYS